MVCEVAMYTLAGGQPYPALLMWYNGFVRGNHYQSGTRGAVTSN